jgi:hypothetical protein
MDTGPILLLITRWNPLMVWVLREETNLAILAFTRSRREVLPAFLPMLPVTLRLTQQPPATPELKDWVLLRIHAHYMTRMVAVRSQLFQTHSTERNPSTEDSGDNSASLLQRTDQLS